MADLAQRLFGTVVTQEGIALSADTESRVRGSKSLEGFVASVIVSKTGYPA